MDEQTIMDIYAFFTALVAIILLYGSMYYYGPIFHVPPYIMIAMTLLIIPLLIDAWTRLAKSTKMNKNNG